MTDYIALLDWRRSVAKLYARVRESGLDAADTCHRFRVERDDLFRSHPQSPLSDEQKVRFSGLSYYPYDPAFRFVLPVDGAVKQEVFEIELQADGRLRSQRFGTIHFMIAGQEVSLSLFWILGYGGGVFLPFRDATSGCETYGGGRYLLDTIKHADLGQAGSRLVIDFNYAYNPSCAYNEPPSLAARAGREPMVWTCPLPPMENWLQVPIRAGEKRPIGEWVAHEEPPDQAAE
ncbi:MAG: DUF1684 domain-containing protein [Ardenticatenaceae bacterium]|nr:DUF1684 domain-containing protein [Ardenticatenaceae bacterium]